MIYLPLDKILDRRSDADSGSVTVRPPITVEAESNNNVDSRQRVER
jgi:hypothetical protein